MDAYSDAFARLYVFCKGRFGFNISHDKGHGKWTVVIYGSTIEDVRYVKKDKRLDKAVNSCIHMIKIFDEHYQNLCNIFQEITDARQIPEYIEKKLMSILESNVRLTKKDNYPEEDRYYDSDCELKSLKLEHLFKEAELKNLYFYSKTNKVWLSPTELRFFLRKGTFMFKDVEWELHSFEDITRELTNKIGLNDYLKSKK